MKPNQTVYLVTTDSGYVYCVFTSPQAARFFCYAHPTYHVIERELRHESNEEQLEGRFTRLGE